MRDDQDHYRYSTVHATGSLVAQQRLNVSVTTAAAEYGWLTRSRSGAPGTVDFAPNEIRFKAYAV